MYGRRCDCNHFTYSEAIPSVCEDCGKPFGATREEWTRVVATGWKGGVHLGLNKSFPAGTSKDAISDYAKRVGKRVEWDDGRLLPVGQRYVGDPEGKRELARTGEMGMR